MSAAPSAPEGEAIDFGPIRAEFDLVEDFPPAAAGEADGAADRFAGARADRTDIALVTIDPIGSMDLDQAMRISADPAADNPGGYLVQYAIADVGALVEPGGALEEETRRRGQTMYLPDGSVPLHPRSLSEGAGSLLPDQDRAAALWEIRLGADGEVRSATVGRATVRSRARLDYRGVTADAAAGRLHPSIELLATVGRLRRDIGLANGAIELRLPAQEVVAAGPGDWRLQVEPRTEFDDWNAQISLLTGICAARIMIDGKVGLLRTLPPADAKTVDELRSSAAALGFRVDGPVGEFLAGVDVAEPRGLAVMNDAVHLLRGAGYAAFDGDVPAETGHAGVGSSYAHVTAPLRRLGDRYATEVCLALCAGTDIPEWARTALPETAKIMQSTNSIAGKVDRACIDLAEAVLLADRVGQEFPAVVLRADQVFIEDLAVIGHCTGEPPEGQEVRVRLTEADTEKRKVTFEYL